MERAGRPATFRSEYVYEIEYELDVRISNQLRSQNRRSSLLLTSRGGGSFKKLSAAHYYLKPAKTDLKSRTRTQSRPLTPI